MDFENTHQNMIVQVVKVVKLQSVSKIMTKKSPPTYEDLFGPPPSYEDISNGIPAVSPNEIKIEMEALNRNNGTIKVLAEIFCVTILIIGIVFFFLYHYDPSYF